MPKTTTPSVERSLDQFIERANQELAKPVDVSAFDPVNREEALRREVDTLKRQLAEAEARAQQPTAPRRGWGALVTAFVVGGAVVFAASTLMPGHTAPVAPEPRAVATSPAVTVEPITPPPAPAPAPPPVAAAAPEPVASVPVAPPPKPAEPVAVAKRPAPKHVSVAHPAPAADASQPAGEKKVAGDPGLYNPF